VHEKIESLIESEAWQRCDFLNKAEPEPFLENLFNGPIAMNTEIPMSE
jgi:hypothetical protein